VIPNGDLLMPIIQNITLQQSILQSNHTRNQRFENILFNIGKSRCHVVRLAVTLSTCSMQASLYMLGVSGVCGIASPVALAKRMLCGRTRVTITCVLQMQHQAKIASLACWFKNLRWLKSR